MKVITVSNIKGGVAKTTTAATLSAGLNNRGFKVLMIDSDPQMNLTMSFINEPDETYPSLYHLYNGSDILEHVRIPIKDTFSLIPGDFELCSADMEFFKKPGSLKLLKKVLLHASEDYDYVIIDTPPNLGFLSLNAFMASDYIVTPMAADSFSLKAIRLLKKTLKEVEEDAEKKIPVAGLLLTKYSSRTNVSKLLEDSLNTAADLLDTQIFTSRIRQATAVLESQIAKTNLFDYAPKAAVTADYDSFIDELLTKIGEN